MQTRPCQTLSWYWSLHFRDVVAGRVTKQETWRCKHSKAHVQYLFTGKHGRPSTHSPTSVGSLGREMSTRYKVTSMQQGATWSILVNEKSALITKQCTTHSSLVDSSSAVNPPNSADNSAENNAENDRESASVLCRRKPSTTAGVHGQTIEKRSVRGIIDQRVRTWCAPRTTIGGTTHQHHHPLPSGRCRLSSSYA